MGVPKAIDTDKYHVGRSANGKGPIRVDHDGQKAEPVRVLDNILDAPLPVVPKKWFAAFQVEAAAAFALKGVDRRDHLREIQVHRSASVHSAVPAAQIAAVRENQPADERDGLAK